MTEILDRVAIRLDGEYVKKTLRARWRHAPTSEAVMEEVARIRAHEAVSTLRLYRIFYYTAEPLKGKATHPIDGSRLDFGATAVYRENRRLIDRIEIQSDVAVRRGTLVHQGWQIHPQAARLMTAGSKQGVGSKDVIPKITQKGVDVRIGLDIVTLALKRLVSTVVIVTGDSDLVPAMKLARREGLRVFLDTLRSPSVRSELKIHADLVL